MRFSAGRMRICPRAATSADVGPDLVLQGGDLAAIGPRPSEVVDRIRQVGWPGVIGNTDELLFDRTSELRQLQRAPRLEGWLKILYGTLAPWAEAHLSRDQLDWLRALPREFRHEGILLVHAAPNDLWRAPMPQDTDAEFRTVYGGQGADLVVYGHIHRPFVRRVGGLTVANTGSVGLPYDDDWRPSYLLIDEGIPAVRRISYDLDRSANDISASGPLGSWLADVQRAGPFRPPVQDAETVVGP